jgi:predicted Zn finger-like uncharacterized protein
MTDIVTRCPECQIAFRAEPSQLSAAGGLVRCGTCLAVFNAQAHIEQPNSEALNVEYLPYVLDQFEDLSGTTDQLEEELNNVLDDRLDQVIDHEIMDIELVSSAENHSKFADMLDQILEDSVTDHIGTSNPSALDKALILPESENTTSKVPAVALLLLALSLLAAALVYVNSARLSSNPQYRSAVETLCQHAKCTIAEYRDLREIEVTQFAMLSDSQLPDSISMQLMMINRAAFSQRLPGLKILFTDLEQLPVAQLIIPAAEYQLYLPTQDKLMRPGQRSKIEMKLADPGPAATNYAIVLLD